MAEKDATSLGAVAVVLPSDLIVQGPKVLPSTEISYQEAIREALREEMARDERVFLLGEDIGKHGGVFGVTRTLWDQFGPEQVRNTPISGNSIVGAATGAALVGMRPVAELMFVDFSGLSLDQIANRAAKLRLDDCGAGEGALGDAHAPGWRSGQEHSSTTLPEPGSLVRSYLRLEGGLPFHTV